MEALDELSKKQIMPIYTFAEDFAIDTGYLLLCCGNEVRANPFSIVGDIGRSVKLVAVQQLLKKLGVQHYAYSSNSKYSHPYNHYKKHDKLESDFLEKMVLSQKEEFSKKFMQKRGLSVEAAQLKPAQIKDILEGGFYIADDALKLGMVDKI
jgi:ClpP class serine protease